MAPSALSHGDGAPGAGAEDCITSARRLWRVVGWVDILLDVIGGVESALREGCPRTMTGVSQCWFSGDFRQVFFNHQCITPR
jgi:hypothetical protein